MAGTLQFVDQIASAPSVRLDLSDGVKWWLDEGVDFSPPPLKRSVVSTLLRDGEEIPASAYENRLITLPLKVKATTKDLLATELQTLNRELDRPRNILKWQAPNASNPVFFRTFRSPDYRLEIGRETNFYLVELKIVAEPFAYGLMETISPITVNNDPAAGSNGMFFDITGVKGDVPTPLFAYTNTDLSGLQRKPVLASRRHGTPSSAVFFVQCESLTAAINTSLQANNSSYSGAGSNYMRTAFVVTSMVERLTSAAFPAAGPGVDLKGKYRVYLRCQTVFVSSGGTIQIRLRWGYPGTGDGSLFTNDTVVFPATQGTGLRWVDLGLIEVPASGGAASTGYKNDELGSEGIDIRLQAERLGGNYNFDWDCLALVPADEEYLTLNLNTQAASKRLVLDGPNDVIYAARTSDGALTNAPFLPRVGSIPLLAPNQTNRLIFMRHTSLPEEVNGDDALTATTVIAPFYWPRYLYVRPP